MKALCGARRARRSAFGASRLTDTLSARSIARFRLPIWIVAVSSQEATCQQLQFSSGVYPVCETEHPASWNTYVADWLRSRGIEGKLAVVTEGPSSSHPDANNRLEIVDLTRQANV
jgi:pyruvate kinase